MVSVPAADNYRFSTSDQRNSDTFRSARNLYSVLYIIYLKVA